MTLFEPYDVSGDEIREVAEQSTAGIDALRALRADVEVEHRSAVDAVEGDIRPYVETAPNESGQQSQAVVEAVSFARGGLHLFAIAVDNFNTNSSNPRSMSKLNTAYAEAADNHFGVDASDYLSTDDSEPTLDRSRYSGAVASAKAALIRELTAEYGRLERQLDDDAEEVGSMLRGDNPRDEDVRTMFEAGALPSYAALLFPNVDFSGAKLGRLPTDLHGLSDEQLATYLAKNPGTYAVLGKHLERLVPGIQDLVGGKIAEEIRNADIHGNKTSEEELRRLRTQLQAWQDTNPDVTAAIYERLGAEDSVEFLTKLNRLTDQTGEDPLALADVFRRGLILADESWTDEQAARFGRDLGGELESDLDSWDALAFLLHDQHYSTELLDPLADKVAQLDKPSTVLNTPIPHGVLDGPANVTEALFSALAKNGEAALNFFSPDDVDDTRDLAHRHEWFLKERTTQTADGLEDLLAALDAATTDESNLSEQSRQESAAGLVSSIAEFLPENDQAKAGLEHGTGATHLAHILGTYMESINDHLLTDLGGGERGAETSSNSDGVARPYLEEDEVKNLVKLAVSNEAGFGAMRQGLSAFQNLQLARDMVDGSISEPTLRDDARLEGFFMYCVGEQHLDVAADKDQRVAAWVDLGKDLVGLIPLPGADQLGEAGAASLSFLAGQVTTVGGESVMESFADNAESAFGEHENASRYAYEARHLAIAAQLADPGSDVEPLITDRELREAAAGYPPSVVESWFGTPENPRVPTPNDIQRMATHGDGTKDDYLMLIEGLLKEKLPVFANGDYKETYEQANDKIYQGGSYR